MTCVGDVVTVLQEIAPPELAAEWDNTGLLLGDASWPAERVLTCLTLTADVAAEAVERRAGLIVAHHPIFFRPVQRITAGDSQGATALQLAGVRCAVYSPHTCYDNAPAGINQQWAEKLGLLRIAPLRRLPEAACRKLVVYVPVEHADAVREAVWSAGAGAIGEYSRCSFSHTGTGTFQGSDASQPAYGRPGRFETVQEERIEVIVPADRVAAVVQAMRSAHPYEVPAFDVIPLERLPGPSGLGRQGELPSPTALIAVVERLRGILGPLAGTLSYVGPPDRPIRRVAIACGAAGEFLADAERSECDALVLGEARFHDLLRARDAGVALVLLGHYASERPGVEELARQLAARLPGIDAAASAVETDPLCGALQGR